MRESGEEIANAQILTLNGVCEQTPSYSIQQTLTNCVLERVHVQFRWRVRQEQGRLGGMGRTVLNPNGLQELRGKPE